LRGGGAGEFHDLQGAGDPARVAEVDVIGGSGILFHQHRGGLLGVEGVE